MAKVEKVMKILNLLEKESSKGFPVSYEDINKEVKIDRKTLFNYMKEFKEAGIEVSSMKGQGGGYIITGMYLRPKEEYALKEALKFLEENNFKFLKEFKGALDTINYKYKRFNK